MKRKHIKIAYIGGGSRLWARSFMSDLALDEELCGEVYLYDIDKDAAIRNQKLGSIIMNHESSNHQFTFFVADTLKDALTSADFVILSILPGTLDDMEIYVHHPEKYGVYQSVGDTTGPAGIFRSLIMMPMYEEIALAIKAYTPKAWVLNFTNPMTMCVQTLYHVFPEIKAIGNCHEVYHVQEILAKALKEMKQLDVKPKDILINVKGINHFTWIDAASYRDIDVMPIYQSFVEKHVDEGLHKGDDWKKISTFGSSEKVKFDLFKKYGIIAAAGDRHLVEFLPSSFYLNDQETIDFWRFHLTTVSIRKKIYENADAFAQKIIQDGKIDSINPSGEEGVIQMKALLGLTRYTTNVNMPNKGQILNLPIGHIVETNAVFSYQNIYPIHSGNLSSNILNLINPHVEIHQLLLKSLEKKDLYYAKKAFLIDPLISKLSIKDKSTLFNEMSKALSHLITYYQ